MAKNPDERYQSVQEMVEAVFGAEHVQQSVSAFSPDSLSMVAARVARHVGAPVAAGAGGSSGPTIAPGAGVLGGAVAEADSGKWPPIAQIAGRVGGRLADLGGRVGAAGTRLLSAAAPQVQSQPGEAPPGNGGAGAAPAGHPGGDAALPDPLGAGQRTAIVFVSLAIASVLAGAFHGPVLSVFALLAGAGATMGILIARDKLLAALRHESPFLQRLAVGGVGGACAAVVSLPVWLPASVASDAPVSRMLLAVLAGLFLLDWDSRTDPRRSERVNVNGLFNAAILGLVLSAVSGTPLPFAIGVLCGTALAV